MPSFHHRHTLPVPPQKGSETDSTIPAHPPYPSQVSSHRQPFPVHNRPLRIGFPESEYTPHPLKASSSHRPITPPHLTDRPHPEHTSRRGSSPGGFLYYYNDSASFAIVPQRAPRQLRPASLVFEEREDLDVLSDTSMMEIPDTRSIYTEQRVQEFEPEQQQEGSYSSTDDDDTSEESQATTMRSPKSHARSTSRPFRCQVCDKDFSCRVGLIRHKRTTLKHKRNMEPLRASVFRATRHFCGCGSSFTRKDSLKRHQRISHHASAN